MNSEDYFIGDWAAVNYWRLTDQIPFEYAIYSTKKQGKMAVFNARFTFKRTTKKRLHDAVARKLRGHSFRILSKKKAEEWMKNREA